MSDRSKKGKKDKKEEETKEEEENIVKDISDIKNALLADVKDGIKMSTGMGFPSSKIVEQQVDIPKDPEIIPKTIEPIVGPIITKQDGELWNDITAEQLEQMDKEIADAEGIPRCNVEKDVTNKEMADIGRLFSLNMMGLHTLDNLYEKKRRSGVKTLTERLMSRKEEVLENYLGVIRKYPNSFLVKMLCDPVGNLVMSNFMIFKEFQIENGKI